MKLRWTPGSPFVRKVTIPAIETGLEDRIDRVATDPRAADDPVAVFAEVRFRKDNF